MRCKLVNFACPKKLRDEYDAFWQREGYNSRAHAIKDAMVKQMMRSDRPTGRRDE